MFWACFLAHWDRQIPGPCVNLALGWLSRKVYHGHAILPKNTKHAAEKDHVVLKIIPAMIPARLRLAKDKAEHRKGREEASSEISPFLKAFEIFYAVSDPLVPAATVTRK